MFKLSCAAVFFLLGSLALFSARGRQPSQQAPDLPPGPMQEKAREACTECHDAGIIVQQRLSKDAWTKEVDKMVRWGTLLDDNDRQPLIDYLSVSFPPDKPAMHAGTVPKAK